jgi:hypothetical protein
MTANKENSIDTTNWIDVSTKASKKPITMKNLWKWWKRVARKIGDFQARIILTIFYFIILGPFALAVRLWSDPLAIKTSTTRGWHPKADGKGAPMEQAAKQF